MDDKYVLQWGSLAGWPYKIAEGLSATGVRSRNVISQNFDVHDLDRKFPYHRALYPAGGSRVVNLIRRMAFIREAASNCSLIHYHGSVIGSGYYHHMYEGKLLHSKAIPMLMSFGGGDARIVSMARAKNPYFYRGPDEKRDSLIKRYLLSISKYIRSAATDCEMLEYVEPYFEKCFIFRQPVDLTEINFKPLNENKKPIILHVPTETDVKGTEHVRNAINRLISEGVQLEFRLLRQLTQKQLYEEIQKCDIYVDDLRCGSYGVTAVECMAAGKPTATYIRKDLVGKYPRELPLVNANPDTIYPVLKDLVCDFDRRKEIGAKGRCYVEKYHSLSVVTKEILAVYEEIGFPRRKTKE